MRIERERARSEQDDRESGEQPEYRGSQSRNIAESTARNRERAATAKANPTAAPPPTFADAGLRPREARHCKRDTGGLL